MHVNCFNFNCLRTTRNFLIQVLIFSQFFCLFSFWYRSWEAQGAEDSHNYGLTLNAHQLYPGHRINGLLIAQAHP